MINGFLITLAVGGALCSLVALVLAGLALLAAAGASKRLVAVELKTASLEGHRLRIDGNLVRLDAAIGPTRKARLVLPLSHTHEPPPPPPHIRR